MKNKCVDCGADTSGVRCRRDNGAHLALLAAVEHGPQDAALLAEDLNSSRLAARLGVSRVAAYNRLRNARRRQALLKERLLA